MSQEQEHPKLEEFVLQRILVGLDDSASSRTALEIAAQMAARFEAELLGIFVQDIDLLRLARLPFAHELDSLSAARRRIDVHQLERQFRIQARRMRRSFTLIIRRSQISGSFRVTRGAVVPTLVNLAEETDADMIVLGKIGRSLNRYHRLGSTTRALMRRGASLTLILQNGAHLDTPILVVYDGSEQGEKALAAAAILLGGQLNGPLTVFVLADRKEEAAELQQKAASWLQQREVRARFRILTPARGPRLARVLPTEVCGTLVLPARSDLMQEQAIQLLLEQMESPVLLVR